MSKKPTKQERIEELEKQLEQVNALNKQLAEVLKMTEDGQWVVISERDLNRYRNGIDALIKAGDALDKHLGEFDPDEDNFAVRQLWSVDEGYLDAKKSWKDAKEGKSS
jgi:soluble cytochrome b562